MKPLSDSRILLVDDSKTNIDVLVRGLKADYKLNVALSGEQALQLASAVVPDLILLDVNMPGLDGYETCRRLRARPQTAEVPIIFLSALNEVGSKAIGFEAGANDYITKPFDLLEVKARVRALLKAKAYNEAIKDQLAGELRVAHDIQMGMLPRDFSTLEAEYGVKLAARLAPAGEVGGDLYAAFGPYPDRLVLVMGDVSGKGIPAALFMVRTLSLVGLLAHDLHRPEQILARLNNQLAADNPSSMFVTLACAVYHPSKRLLILASGGHTSPVLLRQGAPPQYMLQSTGTALGLEAGITFAATELTLEPSDTLLFYTDGVVEAFNNERECYGGSRLLEDSKGLLGKDPETLTAGLLERVQTFAGTARQSDDVALLALSIEPRAAGNLGAEPETVSLEFESTAEDVSRAVESFREFADGQDLDSSEIFALCLGLEECASNIVRHAYKGDPGQRFQVSFTRSNGTITLLLSDTGIPFNPDDLPERNPDDPGGWGLHLARSFLDEFEYSRRENQNTWRLTKHVANKTVPATVNS